MERQTPIYTALKLYMQEKGLRLHMPGHIGGKGALPPELEALTGLDVTEIRGLDDLHLAQGIISAAQNMLAKACGAAESFFLVNGATSGIQALFMSFTDSDQIIIPRNAHRSFYGGMVLSGATPIYAPCVLETELGIALGVQAEEIDHLLEKHPEVQAVFVTNPSFYGTCSDIAGIVTTAKRRGKILMVDEAHGAHFPFHPLYPTPALKAGAAAVVNGLHKTWPVLTQGACLHLEKDFPNRKAVLAAYNILTTTSPSYPLLASIDLARDFMEYEARGYLERSLEYAQEFKIRLNTIKGIRCYGDELLHIRGINAIDPLKVLIGVQGLGLTGYQAGKILREEYHIQVELAEQNLILAMFSFLHERADWEQFFLALKDLASRYSTIDIIPPPVCLPPPVPMILSPRQAFFAGTEKIKLLECKGRIAGEMVAAYPPGIPCLLPGELITEEVWEYLYYLKAIGAPIQGPEEANLEHIKVLI